MGFFSRKSQTPPPPPERTQASPSSSAPPALSLVDNPRTLVLSFLHESSKSTGMRELVKNYTFQTCADQRLLVVIELKEHAARVPVEVLLARWQLLQLHTMRWAQSKALPFAGLACVVPLDKLTPLAKLQAQAQLELNINSHGAPSRMPDQAEIAQNKKAIQARVFDDSPESRIEVQDADHAAVEEFFRLTQPPSPL